MPKPKTKATYRDFSSQDELGQRVRSYLEQARLSQKALANLATIKDPGTIGDWLNGYYGPSQETIYRVIGVFVSRNLFEATSAQAEELWQLSCQRRESKGYAIDYDPTLVALPESKSLSLTKLESSNPKTRPNSQEWRKIAELITGWHFSEEQEQFQRGRLQQIYLERRPLVTAFEDFLASAKVALPLIGKSGMGKSSFLAGLPERYPDTIWLCYGAAWLPKDLSLEEVITRDLNNAADTLKLASVRPALKLKDLPTAEIGLVIDGLNEAVDALQLLREVDGLVSRAATAYPGLKIIFSCRPESWEALYRQVKLTRHHYYRSADNENGPGATGIGFELDSFTGEELPQAYARYQAAYQLETSYSQLSSQLRRMVASPLALRLVATTYSGQTVPTKLPPDQLIGQYLNNLIADHRLQPNDLQFLETELLPLMLSPQTELFSNTISAAQVSLATSVKADTAYNLYEKIWNDRSAADGQPVNQVYRDLVDTGLLVSYGSYTNYTIHFRSEWIYEYFAGRRLYRLAQAQPEVAAYFEELIRRATEKTFLWGAVRTALFLHSRDKGLGLLEELFSSTEAYLPEMAAQTLSEGLLQLEGAEQLIGRLIFGDEQEQGWRKRLPVVRRLLKTEAITSSDSELNKQQGRRLGIELAGELGLTELLRKAVRTSEPELSQDISQAIFHLWRRDPEAGFALLGNLAGQVMYGPVPDQRTLGVIVGVVLSIFLRQHSSPNQDDTTSQQLQIIMRRVIGQIFVLKDSEGGWPGILAETRRKFTVEQIVQQFVKTLNNMDHSLYKEEEVNHYFRLDPARRELARQYARYINPVGDYNWQEAQVQYRAAIGTNDLILMLGMSLGLICHLMYQPAQTLDFLEELYALLEQQPDQPTLYYIPLADALVFYLGRHAGDDRAFALFEKVTETGYLHYLKYDDLIGIRRTVLAEVYCLHFYLSLYYRRTGEIPQAWLEKRISHGLAHNRASFPRSFIADMQVLGLEKDQPVLALAATGLLWKLSGGGKEVSQPLETFLGRLRLYYPSEVETFITEQALPPALAWAVANYRAEEQAGQMVGGLRIWGLVAEGLSENTYGLRDQLIEILSQLPQSQSFKDWLGHLIRQVINVLYGAEVLLK